MSVREGGKGSEVAGWAGGKEVGRRKMVFRAAGKKRKEKRKRRDGPAGLKRRGEKRKAFPFLKRFKHIQFKFKLI